MTKRKICGSFDVKRNNPPPRDLRFFRREYSALFFWSSDDITVIHPDSLSGPQGSNVPYGNKKHQAAF